MKIETLQERIAKAQERVEKKQNTIVKKTALIEKKSSKIVKEFGIDPETYDRHNWQEFGQERGWSLYWDLCDIGNLKEDIKRGSSEIEEIKKTIEKYEAQLAGEIKKESIILKDIPESMRRMQDELVEKWDAYDKKRRDQIKEDYRTMNWKDFGKKYSYSDWSSLMYKTDDQIHDGNVQDAKIQILNLYYRIKDITGEVLDWDGIRLTYGNMGAVLNGFVIGKEGRAEVESITAGGYNIQRLHVRTLVHELK